MSFLTEYFDQYREHELTRTKLCRPEDQYVKLPGQWFDSTARGEEATWSQQQIRDFIRVTMASLRGRSTYSDDYCSKHPEDLKWRKPVSKPRKKCREVKQQGDIKANADRTGDATVEAAAAAKADQKEPELMRLAQQLYGRNPDRLVLPPLAGHYRC